MSQANTTDFNIDPGVVNGDQLAAILNRMFGALVSTHSGASRPAYLTAGGLWAKPGTGSDYTVYLYTGTVDVEILTVTSGKLHLAGVDLSAVYSKSEIDALLDKKYDKTGGKITGKVLVTDTIDAAGDITAFATIPVDPLSVKLTTDGNHAADAPYVFTFSGKATISQTLHLIIQGSKDPAPQDYHIVVQQNQAISDIIDAIMGEVTLTDVTPSKVGDTLVLTPTAGDSITMARMMLV